MHTSNAKLFISTTPDGPWHPVDLDSVRGAAAAFAEAAARAAAVLGETAAILPIPIDPASINPTIVRRLIRRATKQARRAAQTPRGHSPRHTARRAHRLARKRGRQ